MLQEHTVNFLILTRLATYLAKPLAKIELSITILSQLGHKYWQTIEPIKCAIFLATGKRHASSRNIQRSR